MPSLIPLLVVSTACASFSPTGTWIAENPRTGGASGGWLEVDDETRIAWFRGERIALKQDKKTRRWSADVPDGSGRIELRWQGKLRGQWLQREAPGAGLSWSTPLRFTKRANHRWTAPVRPYEPEASLVLVIGPVDRGLAPVLIRDVERNRTLRWRATTVRQARRDWRLITKKRKTVGRLVQRGDDRLELIRDGEAPRFLRRGPTPFGLRARLTPPPPTLRRPMPSVDWPTFTPTEAGLNTEPLRMLVRELAQAEPRSPVDPMVHALLVAHDGRLVLEEYFFGYGPDRPHDTRSAGKSLVSVLFGALAHARGFPAERRIETPFCKLTSAFEAACRDPKRARITAADLIAMRSGLACDDDNWDSPGNEDRMQSQTAEPDWYRYTAQLPIVRPAGKKAVYCTGGINLVGAAIKNIGGAPTTILFDDLVAQPLGIEHYHHNLFGDAEGYFGGGIRLRPRDLLKIGEMMRGDGVFRGQRILTKAWVEASTAPHASIHADGDYGYAWWRHRIEAKGGAIDAFYASGNGGQLLFVVPSRKLVVLFMGGNYGNFGTWRRFRDDYLPRIVKATGD